MFYYFQQQLREAKETIAKVETQIGDNKDTDNKIEDSNNVESESKDTLSESNENLNQMKVKRTQRTENKPLEDSLGGSRQRQGS